MYFFRISTSIFLVSFFSRYVNCLTQGSHELGRKFVEIKLAVYIDEPLVDHLTNNLSMDSTKINLLIQAYISQTDFILGTLESKKYKRISLKLVKAEVNSFRMVNDDTKNGNLDELLSKFCLYQMNEKRDDSDWHLALLLTQRHLYSLAEKIASLSANLSLPETMGMSPVGGIRWPDLSCLVVKFRTNGANKGTLSGLQSPSVVAHEIAHSLGIHHDFEGCEANAIMSPTCQPRVGSRKWSRCSVLALDELDKLEFLYVTNRTTITRVENLPGQKVDADTQCKLHNSSLRHVVASQLDGDSICSDSLICGLTGYGTSESRVLVGPAWEGTACGSDKVCLKGTCRVITDLST